MTAHTAVLLPSTVLTVMSAVPSPFAVTLPLATYATEARLVDHVTDLSVASAGDTV